MEDFVMVGMWTTTKLLESNKSGDRDHQGDQIKNKTTRESIMQQAIGSWGEGFMRTRRTQQNELKIRKRTETGGLLGSPGGREERK